MVHDSVREELETKISHTSGSLRPESGSLAEPDWSATPVSISDFEPRQRETPMIPEVPKPLQMRIETADLPIKKTSPTLVDFQIKNPKLPDWRLQLQNNIRQRSAPPSTETVNIRTPQRQTPTNGANALKVDHTEEPLQERHVNPRVANALRRIEDSRKTFLKTEPPAKEVTRPAASRNYPFNVVSRSGDIAPASAEMKPTLNPSPRPILVSTFKFESKKGFDTNKLPPLAIPTDEIIEPDKGNASIVADEPLVNTLTPIAAVDDTFIEEQGPDEIEDLAPLSMRFNAGLFDLIISGFLTGILMSPFLVSGGNWLSATGALAIAAAGAIVLFLYLTISLAFIGRTFGMKLFSLEMVDVEENAYPTLHQSAVNSAAFILSIAFGGLGFLPIFFNEERRGVHDMLSGTIMVREY
ncbi:MAG TPA: RDD family protein [Pyrinomonadaceae bacterium]|nr:RDD family protein [Pyrinomonadaceae bacterium]